MKLLSTASAIALAAGLGAAPALAAPPPGTGNPAHAPVNNAPNVPANNTGVAAGSAGTSATTNPGALGTAPNPGPGTPPNGVATYPAAPRAGTATAPAANNAANSNQPSQRNPVLTKNGQIRASKVIGSAVYNSHNQQIGSIDDILINPKNHEAVTAVISLGGFLGIGNKLVTVPYDNLEFGNAAANSNNKVVMPGATQNALNSMPSYSYTVQNNGNKNNSNTSNNNNKS